MKNLFKILFLLFLIIGILLNLGCGDDEEEEDNKDSDQTSLTWTWVSGSDTEGERGSYGTMGTADSSNIPGARHYSTSWIDSDGNLWLFGGYGYDRDGFDGDLNDLWMFNPLTEEWTWILGNDTVDQSGVYGSKGEASILNVPGAREDSISWTGSNGNLWLFGGGYGYDVSGDFVELNDLWMFDVSTRNWIWISGSDTYGQSGSYGTMGTANASNIPGARCSSISWTGSDGALYLFGGYGYDKDGIDGELNDLWMFNVSTWNWTWISGSDTYGQSGSYGTMGTADPSNIPGARSSAISWIDSNGNLWLFGGYGYDKDGNYGDLNDLWMFDVSARNWTWISGSDTYGQSGSYGTMGTANASNIPGARDSSISWIDPDGNLWLFGGWGYDANGDEGDLNDLWMFDPSTNGWSWISGNETVDQSGVYGSKGVASISKIPGARDSSISWIGPGGNLWLFGGYGYDKDGIDDELNDLWMFVP